MSTFAHDAPRPGSAMRRRWAALLLLSAAFHALVLGAFALRLPAFQSYVGPQAMEVSLVAPRFDRPQQTPAAPRPQPTQTRVVVLGTAPRYAVAAQAPTGQATDAADLFGPVFADGLWPRPVVVRSEPCDPRDPSEEAAACRRELMLIGLATEASAGAKALP